MLCGTDATSNKHIAISTKKRQQSIVFEQTYIKELCQQIKMTYILNIINIQVHAYTASNYSIVNILYNDKGKDLGTILFMPLNPHKNIYDFSIIFKWYLFHMNY